MATFRYQSVGAGGGGVIDAPDRAAAVRELIRRGVTPTAVEAQSERAARGARRSGVPSRTVMSKPEMAMFVRELATAIQAGLPLVQALKTIQRQVRRPGQRAMIDRLIDRVEHGHSLSDAAAEWGRPFSDLTINLIRAGEASGRIGEVLAQAADLLERDMKLKRSLLSATLYPMILAAFVTIAVIVMVTVIVPKLLGQVTGVSVTLPWPTRVVMGVADFFGGYWWAIIPGVLLAVWFFGRLRGQPGPRLWMDAKSVRMPVLGRLLRDVAVARFTRTLGTLTAAGIPVLNALRVTKGTLGNKAMERVIDEVCEQVAAGQTIADPMERSGYFPPMLVQIVNMGERSGRLDQMLGQAAGAFEERTEMSVKVVTTVLPPILVAVMALVVGFVVMAIMLALLSMQDAVGAMGG